MSTQTRLWIPGPTYVRPEILAACARPTIGHRGSAMKALIESIDGRLKMLFGTAQQVVVLSASGSAAWEAAIRCGVRERWGAITNGAFSERWGATGRDCGKDTKIDALEWGAGIEPARAAQFARTAGPLEAVAFAENETSTGSYCSTGDVARAVRAAAPETMLFVDCVSSLAGAPFRFDEWGLDLALASSQKCIALPPGLAVVAMSKRFLDRARAVQGRGYYLDLVRAHEDWEKHQTPATPAVNLFYALDEQLKAFDAETLAGRFARHGEMAATVDRWAAARGFESFVGESHRSPTTACRAASMDIDAFVKGLKARGHEISDGYGKLKGRTFRIGHLGDHRVEDVQSLLREADAVLASMK